MRAMLASTGGSSTTIETRGVISSKNDLINGQFNPLIDDENIENPEKLVFCSGKFFYDLIDYREKNKIKNVAIVRI